MRHRLWRWVRSDRTFWTLLALTLVGVTAAYYVAQEAEKRQTEWVHGLEPSGPAPTEPAIPDPHSPAPPAPQAGTTPPSRPRQASAVSPEVQVVELVTTPANATVGAMTPACTEALRAKGPWKNAAAAEPWPECVDGENRPMVVQFCTYARLSTGEWVHARNTADAPRCRAELPLIRQGKVRGVAKR